MRAFLILSLGHFAGALLTSEGSLNEGGIDNIGTVAFCHYRVRVAFCLYYVTSSRSDSDVIFVSCVSAQRCDAVAAAATPSDTFSLQQRFAESCPSANFRVCYIFFVDPKQQRLIAAKFVSMLFCALTIRRYLRFSC